MHSLVIVNAVHYYIIPKVRALFDLQSTNGGKLPLNIEEPDQYIFIFCCKHDHY